MKKIRTFTQHVSEGAVLSKGIDWAKLEELCATRFPASDVLPTNAREWHNFIEQWERLQKLHKAYAVDGKIPQGFDPRNGSPAVSSWILDGSGFKHSLLEVSNDIFAKDKEAERAVFMSCNFPLRRMHEMLRELRQLADEAKERHGDLGEIELYVKEGKAKLLAASVKKLDKLNDRLDSGWDLDGKVSENSEWVTNNLLGIDNKRAFYDLKDLTDIRVVSAYENASQSHDYIGKERQKKYRVLCNVMHKLGISIPDAVEMYRDVLVKVKNVLSNNRSSGVARAFGSEYYVMKPTAESWFSIPELKKMKASGKRKLVFDQTWIWGSKTENRPIPYEYFDFIDEVRVAEMRSDGIFERALPASIISEIPAGKVLFVNSPVLKYNGQIISGKIRMPKDSVVLIDSYKLHASFKDLFAGKVTYASFSEDRAKQELAKIGVDADVISYNEWKHNREATHPGSYDWL